MAAMNTVVYFEVTRKKKKMLKYIVWPVVVHLILFVVCIVVDRLFPDFNTNYMKWPDMLKDMICLRSWTSHLWINIWQFLMLAYSFYLIYNIMKEQVQAITEEERLETVVYLHNAGVSRKTLFVAKWVTWIGEMALCCLSLALVNIIFAALLRYTQGIWNAMKYYGLLFFLCMLYLSIALFMAACKGKRDVSDDTIASILIIPLLISRLPALLRFFAALLELTGRKGAIVDKISWLGKKTEILTVISPLTWCWPGIQITTVHVIFGVVVFFVMLMAGFSIYIHRR